MDREWRGTGKITMKRYNVLVRQEEEDLVIYWTEW
jgi:hypothetical protein